MCRSREPADRSCSCTAGPTRSACGRSRYPRSLLGPPLELPPIEAPAMGIWSSDDFALLEEQMTGSSKFCAGSWRYERIDGAGHWFMWEVPDLVNELLLDFLPR